MGNLPLDEPARPTETVAGIVGAFLDKRTRTPPRDDCGPKVVAEYEGCWGEMADHITHHGKKHKALLTELAAGGSGLAKLALQRM